MESCSMTDRGLLEKAAKAAEIEWQHYHMKKGLCLADTPGAMSITQFWNPLTDDRDALRLVVKLRMSLDFYGIDNPQVEANVLGHSACGHGSAPIDGDASEATRRAIVRAAAAMGGA